MILLVVVCLVAAISYLPAENEASTSGTGRHLHPDEYIMIHDLHRRSVLTNMPAFRRIFVNARGVAGQFREAPGTQIEIIGSPRTPERGLYVAADVVAKMTKYMAPDIFQRLATLTSVGVFTASEKLTIFPVFKNLANGNCGRSCSGSCSKTCTMDGRKWEDIAGIGSKKAGILYENLLCTDKDPYHKTQNILAHEFAHTINYYGLLDKTKQQIKMAYQAAKARKTWTPTSYAMVTEAEYFAESSTAFFYVSRNNVASGGMTVCGNSLCPSIQATREQIRQRDPALYNILSYVYTNNRPGLTTDLKVCPSVSFT